MPNGFSKKQMMNIMWECLKMYIRMTCVFIAGVCIMFIGGIGRS